MPYLGFLKKLTVIASITMLLIPAVQAEPYLDINVGANIDTVSKTITYLSTTTSLSDRFYGFRGQAVVGYNFRTLPCLTGEPSRNWEGYADPYSPGARTSVGDVFAALEAAFAYNTGSASTSINPWFLSTAASAREQLQYTGDIFGLGKYQLTPSVVLFLGPGISWGFFQVTTPTATSGNLGVTGKHESTLTGWTAKTGVEINVADNMNLVITYQYTSYNDVTWNANEPLTGVKVTARYKPVINSITLGLGMF